MADGPKRNRVIAIVAAAVLVAAGIWWFTNQQACTRWREDYKVAFRNVLTGVQRITPDDATLATNALERAGEVNDRKPPFCSEPELEYPSG